MMTATKASSDVVPQHPATGASVWREWELWVVVAVVSLAGLTRLGALPIRGEESRRGTVAQEMLRTGEFIVPQLQGDLYFMSARPPLQNWTIALCGFLRGQVDEAAVRLPSAIALLAITVMLYVCGRQALDRLGALASAAAYATFIQVMEFSRSGETDMLFTLFVSASLILWYTAKSSGRAPALAWMLGYGCAALATLTKGPQGPVYFAAPVALFLLWNRDWRFFFCRGHLCGLALFCLIFGAWQVPFFLREGLPGVRHVFLGDVVTYGRDRSLGGVLLHLVEYPLIIACGCLLPWSFFLLGYAQRALREHLQERERDLLAFLTCALVATFPTVWFVTQARPRFYMSLQPCLALLCGLAVQKCAGAAAKTPLAKLWNSFLAVGACGIMATAVLIATFTWNPSPKFDPGQSAGFAVGYLALSLAIAGIAFRGLNRTGVPRLAPAGVVCAVFGFLAFTGNQIYLTAAQQVSTDVRREVAELQNNFPATAKLYSLGRVDHGFAFHWGAAVERRAWPTAASPLSSEVEYFCFPLNEANPASLASFSWKPIAIISRARLKANLEESLVVLAQRLPSGTPPALTDLPKVFRNMHRNTTVVAGHQDAVSHR